MEDIDEDYMIVDLYFDNLVYRHIEETESSNPSHALSLIGGQLSVWLGVRLITLLHLVLLFVVSTSLVVKRKTDSQKRQIDYKDRSTEKRNKIKDV